MKDVVSKLHTLQEVLDIAEEKLKNNKISVDSAEKVSIIVNRYLSELEKVVLK